MTKEKNNIIRDYKKKAQLLKKHNKLYYDKDNPIIDDYKYDELKKELVELEKNYTFLKEFSSVNDNVGSPPSNKFNKIKHSKPMLSLSNAFNKQDMKEFLSKILNFLNSSNLNLELSSEPKIDGISASLTYENGVLVKGLSRGDGVIGEDILQNLMTIKSIPKKINDKNVPKIMEIRGEFYIGKKILRI